MKVVVLVLFLLLAIVIAALWIFVPIPRCPRCEVSEFVWPNKHDGKWECQQCGFRFSH